MGFTNLPLKDYYSIYSENDYNTIKMECIGKSLFGERGNHFLRTAGETETIE